MKKHHRTWLLFAVIVSLGLQLSKAQDADNSWATGKIKGKVLSFTEISYEALEESDSITKGEQKRNYSFLKDKKVTYL